MTYPKKDEEIPVHKHEWAWWFDNWGEDFYGIECVFTWEIPPTPRGKRPRVRTCPVAFREEQLLRLFNTSDYLNNLNRE